MKIKRTNHGAAPGSVSSQGRKTSGTEGTKIKEPVQAGDVVTLSEGVRQANGAGPVEAVNETSANGDMPDPRETSKAILEKELASVFKEIYL